ncbi:MAG: hypothetical protein WD077_12765 [Bacteroidia bacterium]
MKNLAKKHGNFFKALVILYGICWMLILFSSCSASEQFYNPLPADPAYSTIENTDAQADATLPGKEIQY